MPTIRRAEETLYLWLARHYPRITDSLDRDAIVACRREFSSRDARYAIDLTGMRRDFLHYLGERHDYDGREVASGGFDVFFQARQQVEFYDDVLPCLQRLRRRYRLGAISNGNASVDHVGLGGYFEHAVSASEVMAAKPDPAIYRHTAERFGVSPGQIVYVGDHPHYDVIGSIEAGYHAVWVNRDALSWPAELPPPRHEVADLHQLEALLDGADASA
jgi:putative hydrolase of the HAD superfamily